MVIDTFVEIIIHREKKLHPFAKNIFFAAD